MRKVSVFARFPSFGAALVAGALVSMGAMPAAQAQGKPAAAAAKPDKKTRDAARKAYGAGEKAYDAGKYEEAYDSFQKANELIPSPHAEYWMAMALDKQGKEKEATEAFDKLMANPGVAKIGDDKLSTAKKRLGELKAKQVGEVNIVTTPPGASVSVDGEAQPGETPMIVKLPPGAHKISISSAGYENMDVDVDVTAGQRSDQNLELKATEDATPVAAPPPVEETPMPPPTEAPPKAEPRSKVPAYVTLGIAAAGAGVGTFFGIKALSAKSDFNDNPTSDKADDVERNALIADMAFGVAITLGVTGVVLLTSSDSAEPAKEAKIKKAPAAKLNFAPYVSPKGGGAAARLIF
ncbi:MAG: PEGA domain-containing protein [Myxococcales bacterium]|nr:PEGA domain-containing protein [Myxococcales bacterium]MCB9576191.1 PEGA domain-containing protein [Polyangiaceae bacterium]